MGSTEKRRTLVAVVGGSPAVVTETLQVLVEREQAWIPDDIIILTTAFGQAACQRLTSDGGVLQRLCQDFALDRDLSKLVQVIVPKDVNGQELNDIRSFEDNQVILRTVRGLTHDVDGLIRHDTEVHASLAGGRKTQSFWMGQALSLFGRPSDSLSHVLVAPESVEFARDFFYMPPSAKALTLTVRGQPVEIACGGIAISLFDVPVVKLRNLVVSGPEKPLPNWLMAEKISVDRIGSLGSELSAPRVTLNLQKRRLQIDNVDFDTKFRPVSLDVV